MALLFVLIGLDGCARALVGVIDAQKTRWKETRKPVVRSSNIEQSMRIDSFAWQRSSRHLYAFSKRWTTRYQ